MRIIFCGSGPFAVPSLLAILETDHELAGVITQPARPAGRGGKLHPTPIAALARKAGREAAEVQDINSPEAIVAVRALRPEVICVADFGQLIRRDARSLASMGAFNLHASLLPELRGPAPINWAIIRGYERTGVTTFCLVDKMDAGGVYLHSSAEIRPAETAEELRDRLARLGAKLVCETIDLLAAGGLQGRPQDESQATAAPRLKKSDGLIDWTAEAVTVRNLIHGTWSWPGGQTVFERPDGRRLAVVIARAAVEAGPAEGEPGRLDEELLVATGEGRLRILQIKPAGGRLLGWRDFINGYRAAAGDRFIRPGT